MEPNADGKEECEKETKKHKAVIKADQQQSSVPCLVKSAFNPTELLGVAPEGFMATLTNLSTMLPVQIHCEPSVIGGNEGTPIFKRAVDVLRQLPELKSQFEDKIANGEKGRIKFRVSAKGKYVHRNKEPRRSVIMCMYGEQHWMFIENMAKSDDNIQPIDNENWCGFRSKKFIRPLTRDEMKEMADKNQAEGCQTQCLTLTAGDVLTFDGHWWHATCVENPPVLNLFFTPGQDMVNALACHDRRFKLADQAKLKMATIHIAKCAFKETSI